jgi:hypothetical protein
MGFIFLVWPCFILLWTLSKSHEVFFWIQLVSGPQRTSYLGFYAVRRRSLGLERQVVELGTSVVAANYCIDQTENETNRQRKFQRQKNLIRTVDAITTLFLHEWSSGIA